MILINFEDIFFWRWKIIKIVKSIIRRDIPLEVDLRNVEAVVLPTIVNVFGNAWIKSFKSVVDNEIDFKEAFNDE